MKPFTKYSIMHYVSCVLLCFLKLPTESHLHCVPVAHHCVVPVFQDSLHALMATLSASNPFFVRCIKPNMDKVRLRNWPE